MKLNRLLTAAAAVALLSGVAHAQTTPAAAPAAPAPAAAAPAVVAAAPAPVTIAPVVPAGDLVDTLKASGQFKTLVKALDSTNLTAVLKAHKGLTLFAPADAAFAAMPAGELERLMKTENASELQGLLAYHLVNASVDSTKMKGAKGPVMTVAKAELLLDGSGEILKANSTAIIQPDVRTSSGVIHVLGAVLTPGDPIIAAAKVEADAAKAEAAAAAASGQPVAAPAS